MSPNNNDGNNDDGDDNDDDDDDGSIAGINIGLLSPLLLSRSKSDYSTSEALGTGRP